MSPPKKQQQQQQQQEQVSSRQQEPPEAEEEKKLDKEAVLLYYKEHSPKNTSHDHRLPGAVAIPNGHPSSNNIINNNNNNNNNQNDGKLTKRRPRGVDSDDYTEKPEQTATTKKMTLGTKGQGQDKEKNASAMRKHSDKENYYYNDGYASNAKQGANDHDGFVPIRPSQNYRVKRGVVQALEPDEYYGSDNESDSNNDDNDSTDAPGACHVPGLNTRTRRRHHHHHGQGEGVPSATNHNNNGSTNEFIHAELVEEGFIDAAERNRIKREAQQELIQDAAKAEIAGPVDNKKWFACACIATLVVIGTVVGSVLASRPDPPPVINNSFCDQATLIEIGDSITDSTSSSTSIVDVNTCIFETFNNATKKGRWFTFAGNGSPVTASTCINTNFDTRISVFTGRSCAPDELQCIDGNDNNPSSCCAAGIIDCEQRSAVTWSTQNGLQYYVYVHGANPDEVGDFQLSLLEAEQTGNSVCERAVQTSVETAVVRGSNEGAFMAVPDADDADGGLAVCNAVSVNGPGSWYWISGTGKITVASTCDSTGTLEDTQISIYTGGCGNLECVKSNDDSCGGTKSEVSWPTIQGKAYYIYVHSKHDDIRGSFDLRVDLLQDSDIDAQCTDETEALLGGGLQSDIYTLYDGLVSRFDQSRMCRQEGTGIACEFDLLEDDNGNVIETDVGEKCAAKGGRYLLTKFSMRCGITVFYFLNFPECVSYLCDDEWINDKISGLIDIVQRLFEGNIGTQCVVLSQEFWEP